LNHSSGHSATLAHCQKLITTSLTPDTKGDIFVFYGMTLYKTKLISTYA